MAWDPTPTARKLVFVGVVVVLAAVGAYLTVPTFAGGRGGASPGATPGAAAGRASVAGTPGTGQAGGPAGQAGGASATPPPGPSSTPGGQDGASLMKRLPVSAGELGRAADVADRFTAAYVTYRYDEEPTAYEKRLAALATDPIAKDLRGGPGAPAGQEEIERDQVVSTGDAHVDEVRVLSEESIVFVVSADQRITSTRGATSRTQRFAVTVVRVGGGWKVSSLADAAAGDRGDEG